MPVSSQATSFPAFLHIQDLVSAAVGPFFSQTAIDEHLAFCANRGDSGELIEILYAGDTDTATTPEEDRMFRITPEKDRATTL